MGDFAGGDYSARMNDILASNVRAIRLHLGENQDAFSDRFEAGQSDISKWEKGKNRPEGRNLLILSQIAGCSIEDIETKAWHSGTRVDPDIPPPIALGSRDDTVEITSLDLRFSMGPGTSIDDYIEETAVRFSQEFLRTFTRCPPHRLRRAVGVGDSMFPTLLDSDAVWIDTTQRTLNLNDRIWAISLFGAAAIKRLRPIGKGRILVISDNRDIPDQEVGEEDLIIGGRVIRLERSI